MTAKHLIIGHSGNIATSTDLAGGWDVQTKGTSDVRSLVKENNDTVYIFCANGKVYPTTSGNSWSNPKTFDHPCIRAAHSGYSNDILVALADGYMGGRRDGYGWSQWRQRVSPSSVYDAAGLRADETPADIDAVRWVIVGSGGYIATAAGRTANPGWLLWTERDVNPFDGRTILAVERGDGMWISAGEHGLLATSPDGIDWTLRDSGFGGSCIYRLAYDLVLGWLAVGAEGKVSKSPDGTTWEPVDMAAVSDCAVDYSGRRVSHRWLGARAEGNSWMVVGDGNTLAVITECDCYYDRGGTIVLFSNYDYVSGEYIGDNGYQVVPDGAVIPRTASGIYFWFRTAIRRRDGSWVDTRAGVTDFEAVVVYGNVVVSHYTYGVSEKLTEAYGMVPMLSEDYLLDPPLGAPIEASKVQIRATVGGFECTPATLYVSL